MPPYTKTEDGFELQLGANHLGHFLLTGLLLDTILKTPNSRVVSLSSLAHKSGQINFDDLQSEQKYAALGAYSQSKLACLIFGNELQRRLAAAGHQQTISVTAHPGASDTELARHMSKIVYAIFKYLLSPFVMHPPKAGALPTLMAALGDDVKGGEYFGPQGFKEMKGKPGRAKARSLSKNVTIGKRFWEVSEELVGLKYL